MSVVACIPVLNEQDYLWCALESIYSGCRKIVVVEGVTQFFPRSRCTSEGLSVDNTSNLISRFQNSVDKTRKKVEYIRAGEVQEGSGSKYGWLRGYVQDYIRPGEFLLEVDADEVFDPSDIKEAVAVLTERPDMKMVEFKHLMFWLDFHHLLTIDSVEDLQTRLWRWEDGMHFIEDHAVANMKGEDYEPWCRELGLVVTDLQLKFYHMGWVRKPEKFIEKRVRGLNRCVAKGVDGAEYLRALSRDDLLLEAIMQGKMFTEDYFLGEKVIEYNGPWPQVLLRHPWFNKKKEDFGLDIQKAIECLRVYRDK